MPKKRTAPVEEQLELGMDEELSLNMESEGAPSFGPVQTVKDVLASRGESAAANTPEGMEFVGWSLDGWISSYPLYDGNARPVYAFIEGDTGEMALA